MECLQKSGTVCVPAGLCACFPLTSSCCCFLGRVGIRIENSRLSMCVGCIIWGKRGDPGNFLYISIGFQIAHWKTLIYYALILQYLLICSLWCCESWGEFCSWVWWCHSCAYQGCATLLHPGWVVETWHSWSPVPPSVHWCSYWTGRPAAYCGPLFTSDLFLEFTKETCTNVSYQGKKLK